MELKLVELLELSVLFALFVLSSYTKVPTLRFPRLKKTMNL